uniref:tRNA/rRNA methyltransferase (SpoU) n=1 Tax=uncultured bacterium A1Q1_fos_862 TaxID=1256590 RepID=L7VZL2_9BACT|nr:tRNA/rRNA methyltransferase (SpoU) [uncultured bacterium A1Q1_fos_862]
MRSAEGLFLVDGPVLLAEALESSLSVRTVYVEQDPRRGTTERAVAAAADAGVAVRQVRTGVLAKVLDLASPQDVVAVVEQSSFDMEAVARLAAASSRPILALVEVSDPGNVGTLVRSAEASGCAGAVLVGECADVFNPKAVRATAGAVFRVPTARCDSLAELASVAERAAMPLVGTVGGDGVTPESVAMHAAVVIVVGSEAHGLAEKDLRLCGQLVTVPMEGRVESLNAAVAGSLLAFEAARQRRQRSATAVGPEPSGGARAPLSHNGGPSNHDQSATGEP